MGAGVQRAADCAELRLKPSSGVELSSPRRVERVVVAVAGVVGRYAVGAAAVSAAAPVARAAAGPEVVRQPADALLCS